MRTLLFIASVCLFSACASTGPQSPAAGPALAGTSSGISAETSDGARVQGRRAALWTGIGFALYAIYEANDSDDVPHSPAAPAAGGLCLNTSFSVKCW